MSKARVDFPEPLTPVTTVSVFSGMSRSRSLRLFCLAPRMRMNFPAPGAVSGAADGRFPTRLSLQLKLLRQNAAKARRVNQIESFFLIGEELERGLFGVAHDVLSFFEGEIDLAEERRGDIHRAAQAADFLFLGDQSRLVRHDSRHCFMPTVRNAFRAATTYNI